MDNHAKAVMVEALSNEELDELHTKVRNEYLRRYGDGLFNETQRLTKVFDRLLINSTEEELETIMSSFDDWLDELHGNDFFGTEGSLDPRGDFRDSDCWSMYRIQGYDSE